MQGGEVFRRDIDGTSWRFNSAGVWGSGATLTERALLPTGEGTVYSTWGGVGITGPREGEVLERFQALTGTVPWHEFLDRYAHLGPEECLVYTSETLGIGCDEACAAMSDRCDLEVEVCEKECAVQPRAVVDCARLGVGCAFDDCLWTP